MYSKLIKKSNLMLYLNFKISIIKVTQLLRRKCIMAKEFKSGSVICQSGQQSQSLYMIAKGTVRAVYSGGEFFLDKGDIIGLGALHHGSYIFTYIASTDVTIASFPYQEGRLAELLAQKPDLAQLIVKSNFKQIKSVIEEYEFAKYDCDTLYHYLLDSYQEYSALCGRYSISPRLLPDLETIAPLSLDEDIPQWLIDYYENMDAILLPALSSCKVPTGSFINGILMKSSLDMGSILSVCYMMHDYKADIARLLMNENRLDLFDLYTTLLFRIGQDKEESTVVSAAISRMMLHLESIGSIERSLYETRSLEYKELLADMEANGFEASDNEPKPAQNADAVAGSLETILNYSGCEPETAAAFRRQIEEYKKQIDKNATDDASRKLRLSLTKLFYDIYNAAFQVSLKDPHIPAVVKMFFLFGYVDEELAGKENADYLYSLAEHFPSSPEEHVYTTYEWLKAIYEGRKEPSRNEFDTDYTGYIHELKITGKITAQKEREMANDNSEKVLFELTNMFPLVNKITFGRLTTFCPVFSEHNVLKDLNKSLVSTEKANDALNQIRALDFGAYYRETVYSQPEKGVAKEQVNVEILPDIILMPNIGIRGVMWQEIEGKRRTTPARMMISIFQMEDLPATLARLTGEFRWEMCKRVQGARWNDMSEPSLTSEYFDYIQFYKKNNSLTPEAKDKIKSAMQKAKNNYKEMFVRDYITWILFEGTGSPRLNKVARNILFTYCPFSKAVREKLKANPLYKEILDRYDVRSAQKLHHMDNLYQKIQKGGFPIPEEIAVQRHFLES